ncbi:hypothetical protein [Leifsonia sp. TF02-11]|uniref:hypothetical protein n=1 Tax=Leifsonia sp. TF02-11 TaxID=2815212 RepID=UPI001AA1A3CF|nr:hypothetical protein [Leifsonia sp. TF02-11]MBO1739798.1 hypothetical protein [Leifsonia sp. TF02-11]
MITKASKHKGVIISCLAFIAVVILVALASCVTMKPSIKAKHSVKPIASSEVSATPSPSIAEAEFWDCPVSQNDAVYDTHPDAHYYFVGQAMTQQEAAKYGCELVTKPLPTDKNGNPVSLMDRFQFMNSYVPYSEWDDATKQHFASASAVEPNPLVGSSDAVDAAPAAPSTVATHNNGSPAPQAEVKGSPSSPSVQKQQAVSTPAPQLQSQPSPAPTPSVAPQESSPAPVATPPAYPAPAPLAKDDPEQHTALGTPGDASWAWYYYNKGVVRCGMNNQWTEIPYSGSFIEYPKACWNWWGWDGGDSTGWTPASSPNYVGGGN